MALRAKGIDPGPALVYSAGISINGGEAALHRCVADFEDSRSRPTAIFAVSDEVAIGARHAARLHQIKVPRAAPVHHPVHDRRARSRSRSRSNTRSAPLLTGSLPA
jgi:DNA-binding LacI/PurR family transcriptional regulator